ncbi:MAG TPA: autotransporter [Solirubrobacteraceae bacterium]|nr:autotransporter [Solirubrobacteraceae bacterium]
MGMSFKPPTLAIATVAVVAAGAGALWAGAPAVAHRASSPTARAAGRLNVRDEGRLHYEHESGSLLLEEGPATGTLPGSVKVRFDVGATVSAYFTIYTHGGSITGHGKGALHSTGAYSTFGGSLWVTSGTGRFAHAHGTGNLYGAINRRNDALTVQTIGTLYY